MGYEVQKPSTGWTRIKMLVSLYRETVDTLKLIHESDASSADRFQHQLMALSLITAIESGVDPSYGEVPQATLRLCEFARHSIVTDSDLSVAIEVIQNLHDGFAAIQSEAIELETAGVTPKLDLASTIEMDA